jgi:hypothetical protein
MLNLTKGIYLISNANASILFLLVHRKISHLQPDPIVQEMSPVGLDPDLLI